MKLIDALNNLGAKAEEIAKSHSYALGLDWEQGIGLIFNTIQQYPDLAPKNTGGKNDDEISVVLKWVNKYLSGYDGRISTRLSKPLSTVADPIIDTIIKGRLSHLSDEDILKIRYAHRLSMSAENILGLLLEEYLSNELLEFDWHCAWGETVASVDFVNRDGSLLQIKNRSNTENSSSSKIREGTSIKKWYRVDAATGKYLWSEFNTQFSTSKFSEEGFVRFVTNAISGNLNALAVETESPWLEK